MKSSYYSEEIYECLDKGTFGQPCDENDQCEMNLACDTDPSGGMTMTCSSLKGDKCSSYFDCNNNLECLRGTCDCSVKIFSCFSFY